MTSKQSHEIEEINYSLAFPSLTTMAPAPSGSTMAEKVPR